MKTNKGVMKPKISIVFTLDDPKSQLLNRAGYRLAMRCSSQKEKTGSKAQPAPNRM